jgi:hypothetical protein
MTTRTWIRRLFDRKPRPIRKGRCRFRPALEMLEERVLPALGTPAWLNEGPGPRIESSTAGMTAQQNPTTGAVNDVVVSPVDSNTLFAATVNGGIWRTRDRSAQSPSWTPLTDTAASLAISDIAFSPLDARNAAVTANTPAGNLVLYAGTGSLSSFGIGQGGQAVGLLKSTNGGATWQRSGTDLAGEVVRNVVPTSLTDPNGQVVLVGMVNSGVWRSDDGGGSFTRISGNATSNLPLAGVTQLLADPGNPNVFYVALGGSGVYRSNDGGVNWTRIDNGVNSITGLANAVNVKLAVSRDTTKTPAVTVVYAAVAYAAVGTMGTDSQQLTSVFRSTDAGTSASGANWTAMDMPGTTTTVNGNSVFIGVNPGGQAASNLSFAADPTNPNIVYIGGDRQPTSREEQNTTSDQVAQFPNSIGATGYFARLFRGNFSQPAGSQWTPITDNFADVDGVQPAPDTTPGTSPHADSRSLAFTPNGSLLETDDGGIYRNNNPTSALGVWNSVNGNLGVSELTGVAYDPLNNVIIAGAQDNGTAVQSAASDRSWREILGGDGGLVQVDSTSTRGNTTYYYTAQELLSFSRQTRDSTNALVGTPTFLALRVIATTTLSLTAPAVGLATTTTLTVASAAQFPSSGTFSIVVDNETMTVTAGAGTTTWTVTRTAPVAHNPGAPVRLARDSRPNLRDLEANFLQSVNGFYLPYVLNKVTPTRMLLGTTVLYESFNQGDDFIYPNGLTSVGEVSALAYGGYLQTAGGLQAAPDVAYVGTSGDSSGNRLFLRQVANGQFNPVAGYPGAAPRAIALDPSNWKTVYILDSVSRKVYRTLDATAANPTWQDITGNLASMGVTGLRSIEIIGSGANAGIFIGARGGIYATDNVQGNNTSWVRFGTGLPNVLVTSLRYDSTANVLVAGTLGRGAWLVSNARSFVNQQQPPTQAPTWTAPTSPVPAIGSVPVVFSAANNDLSINDPAGTGFEQVSLAVPSGQLRLAETTGLSFLLGDAAGGSVLPPAP